MLLLASHNYILAHTVREKRFNTCTFVNLKYLHVYNFGGLEISSLNKVMVRVVSRQDCLICFKSCFV